MSFRLRSSEGRSRFAASLDFTVSFDGPPSSSVACVLMIASSLEMLSVVKCFQKGGGAGNGAFIVGAGADCSAIFEIYQKFQVLEDV